MKTFHRLNILDDAGSHRAVQQTLFGGPSLEGVSPHLLFLLVTYGKNWFDRSEFPTGPSNFHCILNIIPFNIVRSVNILCSLHAALIVALLG